MARLRIRRFPCYSDAKSSHFVAKLGKTQVGDASVYFGKDYLEIAGIDVEKKYQGRGIGTALIRSVERYAKRIHKANVTLYSVSSAIGFYEKCGYKKTQKNRKVRKYGGSMAKCLTKSK